MFSLMNDFLDFDKDFYSAVRGVERAYRIYRQDDKVVLVINAIGIKEEDVEVKVEEDNNISSLVVCGKTNDGYSDYSVDIKFSLDAEKFSKIDYEVKNGLIYVDLIKKKFRKPELKINKK